MIKKDGRRVAFDRGKIRVGLEKACEKRPISTDTIEATISDIERDLYNRFDREVPSKYVGEQIMQKLKGLDKVAYVRFASVYREFKDIADFMEEVKPLIKGEKKKR